MAFNEPQTKLLIKPNDDSIKIFYTEHSTYNEGDSGLDIFFPEDIIIAPGEVQKINLGISCEMIDYYGTNTYNHNQPRNVSYYLYPRSSISNTPLMMCNHVGVVDAGYRGNLLFPVRNLGSEPYTVKRGERLAQICSRDLSPFSIEVVEELSKTKRGSGGFGSTGK